MIGFQKKWPLVLAAGLALAVWPAALSVAAAGSAESGGRGETLSEIVAVGARAFAEGMVITFLGDGKIDRYAAERLESPDKLVVDIFCPARPSNTMKIPVNTACLKGIRIGYHPEKIRLVLDIGQDRAPSHQVFDAAGELIVLLFEELPDRGVSDEMKAFRQIYGKASRPKSLQQPGGVFDAGPVMPSDAFGSIEEKAPSGAPGMASISDQRILDLPQVDPRALKAPAESSTALRKKLVQMPPDDGQKDTALFIESLNAMSSEDWTLAAEKFKQLIAIYPSTRHAERAHFLLAEASDRSFPEADAGMFNKILRNYEQAIYHYPSSIYMPEAFLGIGHLYSRHKNFHEALGYYNLVLKNNPDSVYYLKALVQKTKILLLRKKREAALALLPHLEAALSKYPDISELCPEKIEMARIFYETNSFHKSLKILMALASSNSANRYVYPDISLYLGSNYYQLGDYATARQHLMRFYNMCPGREISHLVLAQIGDTYREAGQNKEAVKFYEKVLERYPDSEGASISMIRMAEQQEAGALPVHLGIQAPVKLIGHDIGLPRDIYKQVAHKLVYQDSKNPLLQLALVKLAVLYQKEKDYRKSLNAVKELLKNNPWASLQKEIKEALYKLVETILEAEAKAGNFGKVIEIYQQEKKLFNRIKSPVVLLVVARSLRELGLEAAAIEMFEKADRQFQAYDRPPDLLLTLSDELFKNGAYESALKRIDYLLENHPNDKNAVKARQLKGEIFLKNKLYLEAAQLFSEVLNRPISRCEKVRIIVKRAKALQKADFRQSAFASLEGIDSFLNACPEKSGMYQEIGGLYKKLGYLAEAVPLLKNAITSCIDEQENFSLTFQLAQCYSQLGRRQEATALYRQIEAGENPFWSNLAKEKIEEIEFEKIISKGIGTEKEEKTGIDTQQENTDRTKEL